MEARTEGVRKSTVSKYFTEIYHAGALSRAIAVNFSTLFISRRGAKIHSLVIIYYRRVAAAERPRASPRGWRAIIANNKRESHLIIMIVRLLSAAPSNNFVSR